MKELTISERELVALGAALGSNCVPCVEHHVPEARKAGLSDRKISEAIRLADKIRRVPARKVLAVALGMLSEGPREADAAPSGSDSAGSAPDLETEQPCCA